MFDPPKFLWFYDTLDISGWSDLGETTLCTGCCRMNMAEHGWTINRITIMLMLLFPAPTPLCVVDVVPPTTPCWTSLPFTREIPVPIWKEKSFSFHHTERYNKNATIEMVANVSMYPTYPMYLGMIYFGENSMVPLPLVAMPPQARLRRWQVVALFKVMRVHRDSTSY